MPFGLIRNVFLWFFKEVLRKLSGEGHRRRKDLNSLKYLQPCVNGNELKKKVTSSAI